MNHWCEIFCWTLCRAWNLGGVLLAVFAQAPGGIDGIGNIGFAWADSDIGRNTITDRTIQWPDADTWRRVIFLRDYNTRVVVLGTTLLGLAAGTVGSFTLLRKRALMGDALSHATLPGIGLAFIIATKLGFVGRTLPILLTGALVTGVLGMLTILVIRNLTRLKEDAALGIVLSVFFGGGVAVLSLAQQMPAGHAAGLEGFIYGKTASMIASDAWMIGVAGMVCAFASILFYKELKLLCFDEGFAGSRGYPVAGLDLLLMALVTVVTIVGLQAVGLILMIPAAAARFWTQEMSRMTMFSALIGATSCMLGAGMSAVLPRLPSGAMIVLVSATVFLFSMFFGPSRGVLVRVHRRWKLNHKVDRQHLLRGLYEHLESNGQLTTNHQMPVPWNEVFSMRSWSHRRLAGCVRRAADAGLVTFDPKRWVRLTEAGFLLSEQLVHDHRLWEIYLITHADVAPSRVDRDADAIEHVLDAELIAKLEELLNRTRRHQGMPANPHAVDGEPLQEIDSGVEMVLETVVEQTQAPTKKHDA
jgi:manganese/zinc/iron transport system permease protein